MNGELPPILPQKIDDDLLVRWGRPEDADALAEFNTRLHSDDPGEPERWLGDWTRDLASGAHPTTSASDFTVVEDLGSGAIVSSQVLISQTWQLDGISFGVGRPELIGTDEAYRLRGLVRKQMEAAHTLSARKGHLVQAITGIPWLYRTFGYEMALNLGGGREFFWARPGNDKPLEEEPYQIRPAAETDIPILQKLYLAHCTGSLIMCERSEAIWRFGLVTANRASIGFFHAYMISDRQDQIVGYVAFQPEGAAFHVRQLGVIPGHSWRSVSLFVTRELKRRADQLNKNRKKPISFITLPLSDTHPAIVALGGQLEKKRNPYAWYMRVPDIHGFLRHITPVLEKRMAGSVVAGHTGTLRFSFYRDNVRLTFKDGALAEIGRYEPQDVEDADVLFPNLTFLQLLFGYRSLDDLDEANADCYAQNAEAAVLTNALFPFRPSNVAGLD